MAKTQLCSQRGMLRNLKADLVFPEAFLVTKGSNPGQRDQESEVANPVSGWHHL